jgi:hypothetical protein
MGWPHIFFSTQTFQGTGIPVLVVNLFKKRKLVSGHCLLALLERYGGADNYRERLAVNPGLAARIYGLVFVTREHRGGAGSSYISSSTSAQLLEQAVLEHAFPTSQDLVDIG